MSAADWIAEQRRIEQAATEGPWRAAVVAQYVDDDGRERGKGGIYPAGPMGPPPLFVTPDWVAADAEFIADARTALPKMRAALEAVLALHWGEPYAQGPGYCAECEHQWPCETYAAITEALT